VAGGFRRVDEAGAGADLAPRTVGRRPQLHRAVRREAELLREPDEREQRERPMAAAKMAGRQHVGHRVDPQRNIASRPALLAASAPGVR
jgi:hypothetical protein